MTELSLGARNSSSRPRIQPADAEDHRPVSVSARLGRLQFHASGKFRVLQLADIQDGPKVAGDTLKLISAALDAVRPDVVVFTGNQIAGYNKAYSATYRRRRWDKDSPDQQVAGKSRNGLHGRSRTSVGVSAIDADKRAAANRARTTELVRKCIGQFLQPLVDRQIPWVVTYGNHDFQCGLSNGQLDDIYREFPGCLNPKSATGHEGEPNSMDRKHAAEGRQAEATKPLTHAFAELPDQEVFPCQPGTFALPVMDEERQRNVIGLVMLDSGDYAREGGAGSPDPAALAFLRQVPELMKTKSMVFQHFPIPQYYRLLTEVPATTARAVEGYRAFSGRSFILDDTKTLPGSFLGEGISCPDRDSGEFDILKAKDGYFAMAAGHDHRNRFVGELEGIMLAATPTCGFGSYGPAPTQCAARLFEFDIRHPYEPRTQPLTFGDLVGKPGTHKAYTYALNTTADAKGEAMDLLHKPSLLSRLLAKLHIRK
ncbi:serine/threonine protein phosphatase [Bifidobacterium aemilianum]|uniref:Serine/threonine protein phosphatase n=1 Tax=Bifidobacterium aemilianum TaxID=2493120 RepID=A0A366K9R1_9BIFI|nr:metallophosphoesterase [Bifidobacterium aemilianum]RBP97982.1 serine/threonine protein phosphatase [Bifidobacterium aemilianum]